jgi:beta-glucosidase
MSYTTFEYSNAVVPKTVAATGTLIISVTVTDTGKVDGEEVAHLYLRDFVAPVTTLIKALKDFRRVSLKAGASATVEFSVDVANELKILGRDFKLAAPEVVFKVLIVGSQASVNAQLNSLRLLEPDEHPRLVRLLDQVLVRLGG